METTQAVEIITKSAEETKKAGVALARSLAKEPIKIGRAMVIAFEGDLGAGKTSFIQGFARGLGVKESVLSPTFVIQKDFSIALSRYKNFYHIDAYRLKNPEELLELGFEDIIKNPENIVAIEWADKVRTILPREILKIELENLGANKRKIAIVTEY
ncbi:MAG: hypothetical protein UV53_C0004G0019 [Candidatus Azambacteria bacterium GW2011_GWE1_42_9]|nr:MAG: hypothetical protein UU33_C0001G0345 [Candidatus Azambacteria bacterium GW2011_GWF1_41_10]KKS49379.1 MAG: hypothetical protein UV14_C0001G0125 [Candidatus Azambacteria bacterium GW2011_GWF2_42_22]KKS68842.1 MAG: hypothetical protein UV39_C0030G0004 [Candidatus Azambacteria bacterium GW2011_GWA2_42_62]KKS79589.1 MAG: hypothetical protein UV53_C0004G0019 [Candidatus Azambacteria bacterium GW2011_GWE1_42_9]KKT03490.1 MAG: hypothetical protein UV81_C0001G0086 [Candidatus Azambacteria bacter